MYLKRLEMKGFKSFADRTELVFAPGITAIVGPNGSGKSNVTDAIRWVLGEQSAKSLRGAKMEDVIFAGSSTRKPVGFCEVSITFDNTDRQLLLDYAEITLTRRVNRSGESQFFLNKQPCRLKDIQELLMDTGIGKEAYSLIGQGRIDEILSAKSEGRRAIFEEAAGIVKYKTRKIEAERKLAQTEENLFRIHDRIDELTTQIEPIREQAEKAKEWKKHQQALKQYEIALYVDRVEQLHQTWEDLKKQMEANREKQLTYTTELTTKETKLEQIKFQLQQQEANWEQVQAEVLQLAETMKKEEGKENVYRERMKQQTKRQEWLTKRLRQLAEEQQQLEQQQQIAAQQLQQNQQAYEKAKQHLKEHQQFDDRQDQALQQQLDAVQKELQQAENLQLQLSQQKEFLLQQLQQLTEDLQTCEQQIQQLQEKLQQTSEAVKTSTHLLEQLETQQQDYHQNIDELDQQWQQVDAKHKRLEQQLSYQVQKVEQLRSKYHLLEEMQKNREGYFRGVKELLLAKEKGNKQLAGIYGAVAELIKVPAKYEIAIETALGNAMQYLVVADEQVGKNGIAFLKHRQLGRATFLPLLVVKGKMIPQKDLAQCKQLSIWVDVASNLVQTEAKYRPAIDFLLGHVLVVETIEQATLVARQLRHRYRIVTLDGDMVHAGGSMSGGSRKKTSAHLLRRDQQLKQLKQDLEEAEAVRAKLEDLLASLEKEKKQLAEKRQQIDQELKDVSAEKQQQQQRKYELEFILKQQQEELATIEKKHAQLLAVKKEEEAKKAEVECAMRRSQQQIEQLSAKRNDLRVQLEQQTSQKEAVQKQLTAYQVEMARLEQEQLHYQQNITRCQQEQDKLKQQEQEVQAELEQLQQELTNLERQREKLRSRLENLREQKEKVEFRRLQIKKEREQTIMKQHTYEDEVRKIQQSRKKLEATLHEQEVRSNRIDVELNHLLEVLASKYELSFERAKELYAPTEEIQTLEKKVRSLKRKLSQLGDVNLGAIEEYERLSKRLTFFQEQEADLQEAKKRLYDMIEQIEQEMSKQFLQAFEQIRAAFQLVFSQMFGGGKADLQLTNKDQLLETGIEIIAQPPGKRPQYLSLLSGGERALTAIALLFAVLRIKPVPFCVLDEVDAALDEVNLTRFTSFMKQFSHETQFMMITHRKQTMMGADVLYGVTMEESGVSKVVSVQLEPSGEQEVATTRE